MFCSQCGAELPDGAKFCPNCSAKVEVSVDKSLKDKVSKVAGTVTESAKSIGDKVNEATDGKAKEFAGKARETAQDFTRDVKQTVKDKDAKSFFTKNHYRNSIIIAVAVVLIVLLGNLFKGNSGASWISKVPKINENGGQLYGQGKTLAEIYPNDDTSRLSQAYPNDIADNFYGANDYNGIKYVRSPQSNGVYIGTVKGKASGYFCVYNGERHSFYNYAGNVEKRPLVLKVPNENFAIFLKYMLFVLNILLLSLVVVLILHLHHLLLLCIEVVFYILHHLLM